MCEVLRSNFDQKYPEIEEILMKASFVAIDSEFSGLLANSVHKSSLFDAGSERYSNLKSNIAQFIPMQIGFTAFHFSREEKFTAYTYTIPVFPRSVASLDNRFLCQASSFEFLCLYKFDFNKFVYEGVPYLNNEQVSEVRHALETGALFRNTERTLSIDDEFTLQRVCSQVSEWSSTAADGSHLEIPAVFQGGKLVEYILHKELRTRFPKIWTHSGVECVKVERISSDRRCELESDVGEEKALQENLVKHFMGFSRIFNLLIELKKPLVGHNLLLDLMIMYHQFYAPLPKNYDAFKRSINKLFPTIYDTKFISFELKRRLKKGMLNSTALSHLYNYFREGRGRHIALFSPAIEHSKEHDPNYLKKMFHEAGWDSYCTGYCFIRMCHIFADWKYGRSKQPRSLTSTEYFSAVCLMKNCVNVIRADVSHICLDGPDPKSERPQWLHVEPRRTQTINVTQLAELFAKFGSVDVKPYLKHKVLVAVGNHSSARDILHHFRADPDFKVTKYSPIKHSPLVRCLLMTGCILCGGVVVWMAYNDINKLAIPPLPGAAVQ